jgi:hypothetical protein
MVLGDVRVLDCNIRVLLSHVGVYIGNNRVVLGDVGVLEVTTESFRATSAF